MTTAKQTAHDFYTSYNERDLERSFERYVATDLVNHAFGDTFSRADWLNADKPLFPAFPDFRFEILDQIAEGDKVVTRWRLGGTHTGEPFWGVPAAGKKAFGTGISVDRISGGKIVEHWVDLNPNGMLEQLKA